MRKMIARRAALVALLLALASPAYAASYKITTLGNGIVWGPISASSPKAAMIALFVGFGENVPAWAIVITDPRVCRSTHKIVGGGVVKYGYDQRFNYNHCP